MKPNIHNKRLSIQISNSRFWVYNDMLLKGKDIINNLSFGVSLQLFSFDFTSCSFRLCMPPLFWRETMDHYSISRRYERKSVQY